MKPWSSVADIVAAASNSVVVAAAARFSLYYKYNMTSNDRENEPLMGVVLLDDEDNDDLERVTINASKRPMRDRLWTELRKAPYYIPILQWLPKVCRQVFVLCFPDATNYRSTNGEKIYLPIFSLV
jgi:hypothetical protein